MSTKKKQPVRLSRSEKKQIAAAIERAKQRDSKQQSAQDSIPYQRMWPDGICRVTDTRYTKTIQYQDINYQLSQNEDKTAIFEGWCDFLNQFDSSVHLQFSFFNLAVGTERFEQSIYIPPTGDGFDDVRAEYAEMLRSQLAKGNNGLMKVKHLTFGVEADSLKTAKPRLERIESDVNNSFKRLGVYCESLSGAQRLQLMHSIFHMDDGEQFQFSWDWLAPSGLSTKDFIAPSSFEFKDGRMFRMGKKYGAASFLSILAPELNDRVLADFLDMESSLVVNMHVQSIDQVEAIKTVKRKITDLDGMKINEQKKAVRAGYDMDIIPSDLATYGNEAKKLLNDLQSRNERMFLLTFTVINTADSRAQLDNNIFQASSIAQKHNCTLVRTDYQQEEALMSSLPLGHNQIEIQRGLTTSSTAIFIPFTTMELFQSGSEALYYGLNALSNNLIMVDRKKLKNPNSLILGTPGSGKSFAAKREITNAFLITGDDVIVCDPEGEYHPLVRRLGGQVIKISPTSDHHINPMDINMNYSDDESPLALKSDFILSLCELVVGGKDGLAPIEKTVIDRCVRVVYQPYLNDPRPENIPILEDLYNALREQEEKEAQHIASALELYVTGSLNVFNHRTDVDIQNRLVCYDIKDLGKQLKKLGMLIVQDQVWCRVTENRATGKATRYYIDEMHLLLKDEQTAAYSVEIWKRFRKWSGMPTGITQNVKELLSSPEIANILENSDFIYMLNQASGDRQILAKQLNISPHQLSYVTQSGEGEGLLFYGSVILPFVDHFPKNTELYGIMTTKPSEVKKTMSKNPRLQFTKEEKTAPELKKPIRKAKKAADKAEKAQEKIPKQKKAKIVRTYDESKAKSKVRLQFEEVDKPAPASNLTESVKTAPVRALGSQVHKEIRKSEEDNVGVESAHKLEEAAETGGRVAQSSYRASQLRPYRKAAAAERRLEKANVNALYKKSLRDNPQLASNPVSRWQQKRAIKKQYAATRKAEQTAQNTAKAAKKTAENTGRAVAFIARHKKAIAIILAIAMMVILLLTTVASCTMLLNGGIAAVGGSTYPSEESDILAVEAAYAAKEAALQSEVDNYEAQNPGYDEYVFALDMIGHDPHELAAYLSAAFQAYTLADVQDELQRIFDLQYTLTEAVATEIRYRDETVTDPDTGEATTESVAYEYTIMTVTLTNNWLTDIIAASLNDEQMNMFEVYSATLGNKPLLFGGGSDDYSPSYDLSGVVFINGERPGNQTIVDIALSQVGNTGGRPYWSWYGWNSRVAWCACFVSWCVNQAGRSQPYFAYCPYGVNWFSQQGQWARRGYEHIAPGDIIFFDWEPDGVTDHVGIVIGTDGTYVYTVEGNSGDAVRVRSYPLNSSVIYGYGLMNW